MRNFFGLLTCTLVFLSFVTFSATGRQAPARKALQEITFTENLGQVSDQYQQPRPDVLFSGRAPGMVYHLRNNGISYQLSRVESWKTISHPSSALIKEKAGKKVAEKTSCYRLDLDWLGINTNFSIGTEKPVNGTNNYYLPVCPDGVTGVKTYESVFYNELYPGISLHYYQQHHALKYDYIVQPGADYKQIRIRVKGASAMHLKANGAVVLSTPLGDVEEGAPLVFQSGRQLKARWLLKNGVLSYEIQNYNPRLEMIIDPATRSWGTFYGDSGAEEGYGCATDGSGNVFMAGFTEATTGIVIATSGSHQFVFGGGSCDAFVAKFNAAGTRLWGTYCGDQNGEIAYGCCTDANGNVFITGYTGAGTAIATVGSHQPSCGGNIDAFLVKFDGSGVRQWGTYYGGTGWDYGVSCATDPSGNVFLSGWTGTSGGTAIATGGSHQPANGGGSMMDAYLVKFNSVGVRQWGTYYGGGGDEQGLSCFADLNGEVYLAGYTESSTGTIISSTGAHQAAFGGNNYDAYLAKFNSAGQRLWGTYYGGTGDDIGNACTADASGNVFLAGYSQTTAGTAIATLGSHQPAFGGSFNDAFIVKFNSAGTRQWGTYYGGSGSVDVGQFCSADAAGNVYMTGWTNSGNGTSIATTGSHQSLFGGYYDGYIVEFNAAGSRLWGSYYGGSGDDESLACAAGAGGVVYMTGVTVSSGTIIASPGSHQPTFGGYFDAFLVKFCDSPVITVNSGSICAGSSFTLQPSGAGSYTFQGGSPVVSPLVTSSYTVAGTSTAGCSSDAFAVANITVYPSPTITVNSGSICAGQSFTMQASGALSYTVQSGIPIVSPTVTTTYTIAGTDAQGCSSAMSTSTVFVKPAPSIIAAASASIFCLGQTSTLTVQGASSYTWSNSSSATLITVSPTLSGTYNYNVSGTAANGCTASAVTQVNVSKCTGIAETIGGRQTLLVYPNPNTGAFTLTCDGSFELTLVNALGEVIDNQKFSGAATQDLNFSGLPAGIYFIQVQTARETFSKKILVNP